MNTTAKKMLVLLRVAIGWLFFYAGITKVLDPTWTSAGYLGSASTFSGFYGWLAGSGLLPAVDFINEWGLTLIGISLIIGFLVRWSGWLGAAMMLLYYFPALEFPYAGAHNYIVDDHIIYALVLVFLAVVGAGRFWGVDGRR